jgi:hypothetical protein
MQLKIVTKNRLLWEILTFSGRMQNHVLHVRGLIGILEFTYFYTVVQFCGYSPFYNINNQHEIYELKH